MADSEPVYARSRHVEARSTPASVRHANTQNLPAFMSWPVPDGPVSMHEWQQNRCAMCGYVDRSPLVEDHCHVSGKVRGMLCRGCNAIEPNSDAAVWMLWRAGMNPARLLGEDRIYISPFTGQPVLAPPPPTPEQMKALAEAVNRI